MTEQSSSPAVSVVVPVFNEEENIVYPAIRIAHSARRTSITKLFLSTTDRSIHRGANRTKDERARNLFRKKYGAKRGDYAGLKAARGAIAVLIDGDLQNDPADIPKLLAEISAAPISSAAIGRNVRTRV